MSKARDIADSTTTLDVDGGTIKLDGNYPVGSENVALGDAALDSLTSGTLNTAVGDEALTANTTGAGNAAFGRDALKSNTTGAWNIGIGVNALQDNTTGSSNLAIGQSALLSNTTATSNTAVGYQAGYSTTTGGLNTFIGSKAGYSSTGNYNTFVGHGTIAGTGDFGSGQLMTTGSKNTIIGGYNGNQGGLDIRTSSNNIVLSDGDGNPRIWCNSEGRAIFGSPLQSLGGGYVNISHTTAGNNALVIRTSSTTYTTASVVFQNSSGGNAGFIQITGANSVQYNTSSDYRLKENVVELTGAAERLKQIPVHRFNFIGEPDRTVDGFLAHEVQSVVPEAIHGTKDAVDADGNPVYQGIDQSKLVPLLVATIQELEARITALEGA